jgi:pilus assembly protein CpaC
MRPLFSALLLLCQAGSALLAPDTAAAQAETSQWLDIELGKSTVLDLPRTPTAIAITDPKVANVVPLGIAQKIQVQGVAIGSTDLVVQFGAGYQPLLYEVTVHRDLSDLIRRIDSIVEGEAPRVYPLKERIVVQGAVADLDTLEQVALVARIYDEEFVNLMTVRGDHQVQLEVVFAEVSRSDIRQLGINALFGDDNLAFGLKGPTSVASTAQVLHPELRTLIDNGLIGGAATGAYQITSYIGQIDLGAVLSIVDDYKLGKILAQPTLVSLSGQEAEFLAGGQIPVPSPGGQGFVQVQYKDYGVKMSFVPTVLAGNVIDVRVYVEISEPDYGNASRVTGIEIPGFVTRKGSSHMRIQSGMTFAMAGMLSENTNFSRAQVPGLGSIPVIGALFRRVDHTRRETEVVIYVTPRVIRPLAPGEVPAPPGTTENNNPGDLEFYLLGMDRRPGSRTAKPTGNVGLQR